MSTRQAPPRRSLLLAFALLANRLLDGITWLKPARDQTRYTL